MRHFIGGFCVGIMFGTIGCQLYTSKGWSDISAWMVAVFMWGMVFGGMASGSRP